MKTLTTVLESAVTPLYESLLDDEDKIFDQTSKNIENEIKRFLNDTYQAKFNISSKPNKYGKYIVNCNHSVSVRNPYCTLLTNGYFIFGTVKGNFDCSCCSELTSLEGAPEKVGGDFDCSFCEKLISLEGTPKEVGRRFDCSFCEKLTSLEGAPEKIVGDFICSNCTKLISLEGAPRYVGEDFYCRKCGGKFTEEDVKKVSNVKKRIYT